MTSFAWALPGIAYLVGSFPTGVVLSRRRYGLDVREMGSGNIGATNITRNFGWKAGIATFLIDFFKGLLMVRAAQAACADCPWLVTWTGAAVVLGHCYSIFLRGKGGKGVATSLGCFVGAVPPIGVGMAVVYAILVLITRVSAVGSLTGILLAALWVSVVPIPPPERCLVYLLTGIVLLRHQSNIRRLASRLSLPKRNRSGPTG